MRQILILILGLFWTLQITYAQNSIESYLPKNVNYDDKIPTPKDFLGFNIGDWHLSHDQLLFYMKALAAASDRVTWEEYARSHEQRPLILLTISSPENQQNIEKLRQAHLQLNDPSSSDQLNTDEMPIVVNMGYGVHGNEASASNAAALMAYYLAAAQGKEIDYMLQNAIILIDPCLNPDGFQRFATWVNTHKSKTLVSDPASREFREAFPGGRTNHYWFDLNRDWMLLQHPESRGRILQFHKWRPNILTDHHEMGSNSTFFFQPGVPSRVNPLTPARNQTLTAEIANFHAAALDSLGSLYYTKEGFDDFYYGKGSTYPDIHGSVGILFEQGSVRGHSRETIHGIMTFPFAIRNQVNASFSTLKAALSLRKTLLDYQRNFHKQVKREAGAYVFGSAEDPARNYHFVEVLKHHQIEVYQLGSRLSSNGKNFEPGSAYVVPLNQSQNTLIKTLFETQTKFQDSLFYDVSGWTLPLAFNLPYTLTTNASLGEKIEQNNFPKGKMIGGSSNVAYCFAWDHYYAPRAAQKLLSKGLVVKVFNQPSSFQIEGKTVQFGYGTIMIPALRQKLEPEALYQLLQSIAQEDGVEIYALPTGLAQQGIDMGSNNVERVYEPRVLMLVGRGIRSYEVGEVWHLLDHRYKIPIVLAPIETFGRLNLYKYNTLVMVSGSYNDLQSGNNISKLNNWVLDGNNIIAIGSASSWLNQTGMGDVSFKEPPSQDTTKVYRYVDKQKLEGAQEIGGAIFEAQLDISHPLGYGFKDTRLPVFKNNRRFMKISKRRFVNPLFYGNNPLLSGYISKSNLERLRNSAVIHVSHFGRGKIIAFADNPNFRAYWMGTNKLMANALFFASTINR